MDLKRTVSNRGTLTCYITSPPMERGKLKVLGMDPVDIGLIQEGEIIIPVFVQFDGSDSNVNTLLIGGDPETVHIGMRVEAVFAENPKGALSDLEGVKPIE